MAGPFLADGKNNDAAIAECIFKTNDGNILDWLEDDDVIVVDRGFRDAVGTMAQLGFRVQIPCFLRGRKQLPTREANSTRCVTKVRWVIESGMKLTHENNSTISISLITSSQWKDQTMALFLTGPSKLQYSIYWRLS